jgi:hypothetical protein
MNESILDNLDPETCVYRIFGIERLFQLFDTKKNILVHPSKWDDPFENFILSGLIEIASGEKGKYGFKDHVFGQCWTTKRESDAMWRIYSPEKNGVRVRTRVKSLIEGLRAAESSLADISCFVGKVSYLPQNQLKNLDINVLDPSGKGIAKTLLYKRNEFSHEKEVRLIYSMPNPPVSIPKIFSYGFDPCTVLDEITFDPRIDKRMSDVYTHSLADVCGFPKRSINTSKLYAPPPRFITQINA